MSARVPGGYLWQGEMRAASKKVDVKPKSLYVFKGCVFLSGGRDVWRQEEVRLRCLYLLWHAQQ